METSKLLKEEKREGSFPIREPEVTKDKDTV